MKVCPGVGLAHKSRAGQPGEWGQIVDVWEGYAADPEIRFRGSSGGAATAIAHYCLEHESAASVLHIRPHAEDPLRNQTVFSRSYDDLLASTGSRYSPAAPCEYLDRLFDLGQPCVIAGKPCDIAAVVKYCRVYPEAEQKVLATISIFCAGTPSTQGTIEVLKKMGLERQQVESFRYRGCGWPGNTVVRSASESQVSELTYAESWGRILSKHVAFRCRLCPDSTGEFADISCGDPWYRTIEPGDPGRSLLIARTEKGRQLVRKAEQAGYLILSSANRKIIALSQKSLLSKRRNLWGRLAALRFFGIPVPKYSGFRLFSSWRKLAVDKKAKSLGGTVRRILQRKWYRVDAEETIR